jgi:hypothetical protein
MEEGLSTGDFESWMALRIGASLSLSQEVPWRGPRGVFPYWANRKMGFLRDIQNAVQAGLTYYRGHFVEPGGISFAGTFERNE